MTMVKILSLYFLLFFLFSIESFAKVKAVSSKSLRCVTKPIAVKRSSKPKDLKVAFDKTSRPQLTQNLWYELTFRPKNDLALPMLQYLIETEKNENLKSYYKVLGVVAYNTNVPVNTLYQKYPQKKQVLKNKKIKVNEVCLLYNKTVLKSEVK